MGPAFLLDRAPTFAAYMSGERVISSRLELLSTSTKPVDVSLLDLDGRLELTAINIAWLAGLYPAAAWARIGLVLSLVSAHVKVFGGLPSPRGRLYLGSRRSASSTSSRLS